MVVLGEGAVSYERVTPVSGRYPSSETPEIALRFGPKARSKFRPGDVKEKEFQF